MAEVAGTTPRAAIVFIGFMGAGKSAAARAAAERLGVEAHDSDVLIEAETGERIADIFAREGEGEFRAREREVILPLLGRAASSEEPFVVALGGGAVEAAEVREALAGHLCVWCDVDEATAWERSSEDDTRPLAADRGGFSRRFEARAPVYRALARAILPAGAREAARGAAPWLVAMLGEPGTRMAWAEADGGGYPAIVGEGAIGTLEAARGAAAGTVPDRLFCVADGAALSRHESLLPPRQATVEVEGAESSKTLAEAERVLTSLAEAGARRDDGVLAFGGGVAGDLAGFVAATYQRGIPVIQAPTTLVAQVDSAYGGKTGVDLPAAKNYVGAFHQPSAVLADPRVLSTLPAEELAAGFVEVLKTALLAGGELWDRVRSLDGLDPSRLGDVIFDCARTKIEVVASDERDSGRRAILNLGHTVGHGIEAATGYARYRHGEAVGLGLLAALRLSDAGELRSEVEALLEAHGLPTRLDPSVDTDAVMEAIGRDKKATAEGVGFVLLSEPGRPRWGERVDADRVRACVEELR